ncbi:MAG: hypothetical protein KDC79_08650 [Cyclobacteriaceae bacterium]|nr:hypothetical protein [Cyclobacteriaceae bacterium]
MTKTPILIFFLTVFGFSCSNNNYTEVDDFSVIIIHDDDYSKHYKTYTPTPEDISKGLELLGNEISMSKEFDGISMSSDILNHVYKQYLGYYENGNRMILINCLCELFESPDGVDYFHQGLEMPDDGGICYFRGYVDLTNGKCKLMVNGN